MLSYMSAYNTSLSPIEKLQNRVVRISARAGNRESSGPLYVKLGILPLRTLYAQCLLVHCHIVDPVRLSSILSECIPTHTYETRNRERVRLPSNRLVGTDKLYTTRYLRLRRLLEEEIKKIEEGTTRRKKRNRIKKVVRDRGELLLKEFLLR